MRKGQLKGRKTLACFKAELGVPKKKTEPNLKLKKSEFQKVRRTDFPNFSESEFRISVVSFILQQDATVYHLDEVNIRVQEEQLLNINKNREVKKAGRRRHQQKFKRKFDKYSKNLL